MLTNILRKRAPALIPIGKAEIMNNGLDLLLKDDRAFICESVDFVSSFVLLKILSPEDTSIKFDVWIPTNYIQFVLRGTPDNSNKVLGFSVSE